MRQHPLMRDPDPTLRGTVGFLALVLGLIFAVSYPALAVAALAGATTVVVARRIRCRLSAACATRSPLEAARASATR